MKAKRILITGAGGFVGRNIAEYKWKGCEVYAARHAELDVLDENAVRKFISEKGIDTIIHCAAVGGSRKTNYDAGKTDVVSKNLRMFFNIVRCMTPETRMIHMGSGAEYDKHNPLHKVPEEYFDQSAPQDDYGYSKYVVSKYIEKTDNITCLRLFGVYGRYEDYHYRFISNAIVKNLLRLPVVIKQNVVFDYLYVDDLVSIAELMLKKKTKHKTYNATPTESIDLLSIAKIINDISDFKSEIRILDGGMNKEYSGGNSRLLRELKGFKFTSYKEGVKAMYDYYSSILSTIDADAIKEDPYLKNCRTL